MVQSWVQNQFFCNFLDLVHYFSWKLHRTIVWNNLKLLEEVNSSKKIFEAQTWAKIGSNIRGFFTILSSLVHQVFFKLYRMIAWNNVLLVEVKLTEKVFWGPKLGEKSGFLPFSQVCIINFLWCCTGLQLWTSRVADFWS